MHPIPPSLQMLLSQWPNAIAHNQQVLVYDQSQNNVGLRCFDLKYKYGYLSAKQDKPPSTLILLLQDVDAGLLKDIQEFLVQRQAIGLGPSGERPSIIKQPPKLGLPNSNPFTLLYPVDVFLRKVNWEIENHLEQEDYRACQIAKALNICSMQLYRKLKKLAGLSPSNYVRKYRLLRSQYFLQKRELSISEVCYRVGFRSLEYFSRSFKKEFGVSPTKFRTEC